MTKFKVGDRVRAIKIIDDKEEVVNQIGTIIDINNRIDRFCVEFDNYIGGHGGSLIRDILGKNGHCLWCDHDDLEFAEFEKIVITTDGKTTTAKFYHGKTVCKTATTKCSPDDKFDFVEGAKIAFDRLTDRETHKSETGKIKVGDLVKVVNTGVGCSTAIDIVMNLTTNPRLIARYAYGNDLGYCKGVRMLDETFKVLAINTASAYITKNINSDYSPCYIVGISGLKKIGG